MAQTLAFGLYADTSVATTLDTSIGKHQRDTVPSSLQRELKTLTHVFS
jgi:hypothetical protein